MYRPFGTVRIVIVPNGRYSFNKKIEYVGRSMEAVKLLHMRSKDQGITSDTKRAIDHPTAKSKQKALQIALAIVRITLSQ